jgi:hypothetical protein
MSKRQQLLGQIGLTVSGPYQAEEVSFDVVLVDEKPICGPKVDNLVICG